MKLTYQGQPYELPDDASVEEINQAVGFSGQLQQNTQQTTDATPSPPKSDSHQLMEKFKNAIGAGPVSQFAQNFAGGLLNQGASIVNKLPDLSQVGNIQGQNPFSNNPANKIDAYKLMGTQDQPFYTPQGAAQTAGELFAPGKMISQALPAIKKFAEPVTNAFAKINPAETAKIVQTSHDVLKNDAISSFNKVGEEAEKRGINIVPIDKSLIEDISDYLPNTRASKSLIEKASTGDYSSLRKLQSDLWQRGTSRSSSKLAADRDEGEEILDLRDKINESISKHFKDTGHEDLANQLQDARSKYYDLQKTYFGKKVPLAIKNLVHEDSRKIPKNIMNVLSEDSVPMQRIMEKNPLAAKQVELMKNKKNALTRLKYLGLGGGALATAAALGGYGVNKYLNPVNSML